MTRTVILSAAKDLAWIPLALTLTACNSHVAVEVTDAPVDEALAVVIQFNGVDLLRGEGSVTRFDFDPPKSLDLLDLEGGEVELLLDQDVKPDTYTAVRLRISADGNGTDSYIERSTGRHALLLDEDDVSRLRVTRSFVLEERDSIAFTIDFDLRKSIRSPAQDGDPYQLVPALRMLESDTIGSVGGTVDPDLVPEGCAPAVYAWSGSGAIRDDVGSTREPVNTSIVRLDDEGDYRYRIGVLTAGDYTLAFTCEAGDDEPDSDDAIEFSDARDVEIRAERNATSDF